MTADTVKSSKSRLGQSESTVSDTATETDFQVVGTINTDVSQRFKPRLNITTNVAVPSEFYNELQDYIDTISQQIIIDKLAEVRQEIKLEYEEKYLAAIKRLVNVKAVQASEAKDLEGVKSFIRTMSKPSYLRSVILNYNSRGCMITFVHESNDRVQALHELEELLSLIEDNFPNISFEPSILHSTDEQFFSETALRVDFSQ